MEEITAFFYFNNYNIKVFKKFIKNQPTHKCGLVPHKINFIKKKPVSINVFVQNNIDICRTQYVVQYYKQTLLKRAVIFFLRTI